MLSLMPLSEKEARANVERMRRYAGTPGPWTAQVVETMHGLGARHYIAHDQGETYPAWVWKYAGAGFSLDTCGYEDPDTGQWTYVAELGGPRKQPDEPFLEWLVPAINFTGPLLGEFSTTVAGLLNHGLARTSATTPTSVMP